MQNLYLYAIVAVSSLLAIAMISASVLRGWREWLGLQHIAMQRDRDERNYQPSAGSRIELADLKERIRKLEAIASGVEL